MLVCRRTNPCSPRPNIWATVASFLGGPHNCRSFVRSVRRVGVHYPPRLMVPDARKRAPRHEDRPHPEEPAFAGVSKDEARSAFLLLAVAQPAIDRAEHVAIIVGPDPLVLVGLGQ